MGMGKDDYSDYQKKYQKDMEHLSQVFHDDEPKTFKEHMADLWDEMKMMGKAWTITGITVAGLIAGFTANKYHQNKHYMDEIFVPAFRENLIAQQNYVNHPSKKSENDYFQKRSELENLTRSRVIPARHDPKHYIEFYTNFFYISDCKEKISDIPPDYSKSESCFLVLGKSLENIKITRGKNFNKKVTGYGHILEDVEKFNLNKKGNFHITHNGLNYFIIESEDSKLEGMDRTAFLKREIKKMNPDIK